MDWYKEFNQTAFLELIAGGKTEVQALASLNMDRDIKDWFKETHLVLIQIKDKKFNESLEDAKKQRADSWFNGVVESVQKRVDKEEVAAEKLKFEQRKWLAAIDNPEKYSEKSKSTIDVNVNIFNEMKELKYSDVKELMKNDPFAVPVEFEVVEEDGGNTAEEGMFE
jgi:hypothetical protein